MSSSSLPTTPEGMYQFAQELCPPGVALCPRTLHKRQQATEWYIKAWRSSDNTNANYPAYAASLLLSLGRFEEVQEALDAALAIDPLNAEACSVHISLLSQKPGDHHDEQMLANQNLAQTESAKRDRLFGPCIDYINEHEHEVTTDVSENGFKVGALVVIGNEVQGYQGQIALVSKDISENRVTIQLLDQPKLKTTTRADSYSTAIVSLRTQLSQDIDINSLQPQRKTLTATTTDFHCNSSTARIQPKHLTSICNYCYQTPSTLNIGKLKKCSRCKMASYCTGTHQKDHWKQHKNCCKALASKKEKIKERREKRNVKGIKIKSHPSWKHRTKKIERMLKDHHRSCGCSVPWPLTHEIDAMMEKDGLLAGPCFASIHPNQRFSTKIQDILSIRTGNKRQGLFLQEDPLLTQKMNEGKEWLTLVPPHTPIITECMVLGEVIVHPSCLQSLTRHYSNYPGKFFKWPTGEYIGICPATNQKIKADAKTKHLLITWTMYGAIRTGDSMHLMNRVWPRLLTIEGYEQMVGGNMNDSHRCINVRKTTVNVKATESQVVSEEKMKIPFYPECVRSVAKRGIEKFGKSKGKPGHADILYVPKKARAPGMRKGLVPLAADTWQRYSEDLWEKDYESHVMQKYRENIDEINKRGNLSIDLVQGRN